MYKQHTKFQPFLFLLTLVFLMIPAKSLAYTPNDPLISEVVGTLDQIKVRQAWDRVTGSRNVVVAVLDAGIDTDHPDLQDNMWRNPAERLNGLDDDGNGYIDDIFGWDFVSNDASAEPDTAAEFPSGSIHHGTVVAGLIGAVGNNNIDASGVAMHVQIMSLKVMDNYGRGDVNAVIPAIEYAKNMGADIINLSFSGHEQSTALKNAMKSARQAGLIVVVAAGNDNDENNAGDLDRFPKFPVCSDKGDIDTVIGVGAVAPDDTLASFSNFGSCIDVVAPGTKILSTIYNETENPRFEETFGGYFSGTSLAAPLVSGAAALLKSQHPDWSSDDIINTLYSSADSVDFLNPSHIGDLGHGRINVDKATRTIIETIQLGVAPIAKNPGGILVVAPISGGLGEMRLIDIDEGFIRSFQPTGTTSLGVRFIADDLDNDGTAEIIVVNGQTLQIITQHGVLSKVINQREPGYNPSIAAADITGDGKKEIMVTYEQGSSTVYLYTHQGYDLGQFEGSPEHVTGLRVAAADITGDGAAEIITAAASDTESADVWVYLSDGNLYTAFQAFVPQDNIDESKGHKIATADIDGDGIDEVVVTPANGPSVVRVYKYFGSFLNEIYPYNTTYKGSIEVASGDLEGDGIDEILVSAGKGGGPHVKMVDYLGNIKQEWFVYDPSFKGGTRVQFIKQ